MKIMLNDRDVIKFKNNLSTLSTSSPLSLVESRLVFNIISQIDLYDSEFNEYEINASALFNEIKNELKSKARERSKLKNKVVSINDIAKDKSKKLEMFCTEMLRKNLKLPPENDNGLNFNIITWFSKFEYDSDRDVIVCKLESSLKPYLLDFKNSQYKKCFLSNMLTFRSKYSHKFYLLLKTNLSDKNVLFGDMKNGIPLEWFRDWLGIKDDEYKLYAHFKLRILEAVKLDLAGTVDKNGKPTFKENAKAEVSFTYEEIKTGKKITHLKLKTIYNPYRKETISQDCDQSESNCNFDSLHIEDQPVDFFFYSKQGILFNDKEFKLDSFSYDTSRGGKINISLMDTFGMVTIVHLNHKNKEKMKSDFILSNINKKALN